MNLSGLAIRRPVAVLMAVSIMVVLGVFSFVNLPVDLLPEMKFPVMVVVTNYEGAAPEEVEAMVTRPLEQVLATVPAVERITSTSSQGSSSIVLEFTWGTDMDFRSLDVREKVDLGKSYLPADVKAPLVIQADPSLMPIIQVSVLGEAAAGELKRVAEDLVKPRLERIEGVASVSVMGAVEREIQIVADPSRLAAYGVTLDQLSQLLRAENLNISAGRVSEGSRDLQVRTVGEFRSISDIENLVLASTTSGTILLKDVAKVEDTFKEHLQLMRLDGRNTLGIAIYKQSDANTVTVSSEVRKALSELSRNLPDGSDVNVLFDQADFIRQSVGNVMVIGLVGAVLAIFVLYLFLQNFRSTLVIGLAIPVSVISTFMLMYFNNLTLNILTLGGLALGIGMMVDNAIVILENIFRFRQQGHSAKEAAAKGSAEVADAIMAATLTTVVVFLPVVFVKGIASQIFSSMAWTISFALLASLAVALTVVPVLSSQLLKIAEPGEQNRASEAFSGFFARVDEAYGRLLRWALGRRKLVIGFMVGAFLASLALVPLVGTEFIPGMDDNWLNVTVRLPDGSRLADTSAVAERLEDSLRQMKEVSYVYSVVGGSSGMGGFSSSVASNRASLEVRLTEKNQRKLSNDQVADKARQAAAGIPGAEVSVRISQSLSMGGSGQPVDILVKGDSLAVLRQLTNDIKEIVEKVPGTRETGTSFDRGWPELHVVVNRERAAFYGLQSYTVASTLRTALGGQLVTRYRTGGREVDVRLTVPEALRASAADLKQLEVASPYGMRVPLGEVADFRQEVGPARITRDDQVRSARVTAQLAGRALGQVVADINNELVQVALPPGYTVEFAGERRQMSESYGSLAQALALAVLLVYMIMAAQFESLLHPFIIMFTLPQTFIGVVLSLVITGRTLNVPAFVGLIMLAGIVVNNAIVLVDYINKLRERGLSCREAILTAGPVRLRPILMTTMTTVLGMLPLASGIGSGSEVQAPLATVVVGGLTVSTVLTLVVVPVIYSSLDDLGLSIRNRKKIRTREMM